MLGADTILVRMGETRSGAKALAVEADRERLLTLLGVSYWDQVSPDIVKKIEETLQYPGQVKVTVIRESRSVDVARNHTAVQNGEGNGHALDRPVEPQDSPIQAV